MPGFWDLVRGAGRALTSPTAEDVYAIPLLLGGGESAPLGQLLMGHAARRIAARQAKTGFAAREAILENAGLLPKERHKDITALLGAVGAGNVSPEAGESVLTELSGPAKEERAERRQEAKEARQAQRQLERQEAFETFKRGLPPLPGKPTKFDELAEGFSQAMFGKPLNKVSPQQAQAARVAAARVAQKTPEQRAADATAVYLGVREQMRKLPLSFVPGAANTEPFLKGPSGEYIPLARGSHLSAQQNLDTGVDIKGKHYTVVSVDGSVNLKKFNENRLLQPMLQELRKRVLETRHYIPGSVGLQSMFGEWGRRYYGIVFPGEASPLEFLSVGIADKLNQTLTNRTIAGQLILMKKAIMDPHGTKESTVKTIDEAIGVAKGDASQLEAVGRSSVEDRINKTAEAVMQHATGAQEPSPSGEEPAPPPEPAEISVP